VTRYSDNVTSYITLSDIVDSVCIIARRADQPPRYWRIPLKLYERANYWYRKEYLQD
jgi:hypothetical protein